ncbi:hypothetical protein [Streptomyces sp. NBC_01013]|uniref:hypothetical protein n=1 Tax=Streptomyces sp. NBC_01013 TaxID=2903718 RepID=UPI00386EB9EE
MSATGGISAYGGVGPAPGAEGRGLPRAMGAARLLVHVLFGATLLGGVGLLGSALAADALDGVVVGLLLYGALPGVVGWLLSRRVWTGGRGVWGGLVAVQVWLIVGGAANAADGSLHGFTQVFLPVLILVFLARSESREWFRRPVRDREDKPDFSLPHMITWRRDRGQSALEYVGLVMLVAAIVVALLLSGVGGPMADRFQAAVCSVTGTSCPATGDGSGTVNAGDSAGGADTGGADEGATVVGGADGGGASAGTGGASAGTGGAGAAGGAGGSAAGGAGGAGAGGADGTTGSTGGAGGAGGADGSTGSTGGADGNAGSSNGGTTRAAPPEGRPGRTPPAGRTRRAARTRPEEPTPPAVRAAPTVPAATPTRRTRPNPRPGTTTSPRPGRTSRGTPATPTAVRTRRTAAAGASSAAPGTGARRSSRASSSTASGAM